MRESTDLERAYTAGFMDGEGSIFVIYSKEGRDKRGYHRVERYSPGTAVGNTHIATLQWLEEIWGGSRTTQVSGPNWQRWAEWRLHSVPIIYRLLTEIQPYLRVKAPQAALMLEWLALPTQERTQQAPLVKKAMGDLNARGAAAIERAKRLGMPELPLSTTSHIRTVRGRTNSGQVALSL